MSELKQWRLGMRHLDLKNGGEFRVLSGRGEGWIGDIRAGSKLENENCALICAAPALLAELKRAKQLANRALDWNLPEVEIDGEMVDTLDLMEEFTKAIAKAETA